MPNPIKELAKKVGLIADDVEKKNAIKKKQARKTLPRPPKVSPEQARKNEMAAAEKRRKALEKLRK